MENTPNLDKFFRHHLSVEESDIKAPDSSLIAVARRKVVSRKIVTNEADDYLALFASFLNLKIKLYHAVIASLIIGLSIFYFTKNEKTNTTESPTTQYVSNIASVGSSTVLSSIKTFAVKN
jgi:hypothetical protein